MSKEREYSFLNMIKKKECCTNSPSGISNADLWIYFLSHNEAKWEDVLAEKENDEQLKEPLELKG